MVSLPSVGPSSATVVVADDAASSLASEGGVHGVYTSHAALSAEVASLETELAAARAAAVVPVDKAAVAAAEVRCMRLEAELHDVRIQREQERQTAVGLATELHHLREISSSAAAERKALGKQLAAAAKNANKETSRLSEQLIAARAQAEAGEHWEEEAHRHSEALRQRGKQLKEAEEKENKALRALAAERSERQQLEARLADARGEVTAAETKAARLGRDCRAKEAMLKDARAKLEAPKGADAKDEEKLKKLEERARAAAVDASRKERLVSELREKLERVQAAAESDRAVAEKKAAEAGGAVAPRSRRRRRPCARRARSSRR